MYLSKSNQAKPTKQSKQANQANQAKPAKPSQAMNNGDLDYSQKTRNKIPVNFPAVLLRDLLSGVDS